MLASISSTNNSKRNPASRHIYFAPSLRIARVRLENCSVPIRGTGARSIGAAPRSEGPGRLCPGPSGWVECSLARLRFDHEGEHLVAVTEPVHPHLELPVARLPDLPAPLGAAVEVGLARCGGRLACGARRPDGGRGFDVRVDDLQLFVVVLVGMLVGGRVTRVVHARPEVSIVEVLVLVVQPQGVADFLAHHQVPPGGGVVLRGVEVRIVDLGGALRDVLTAYPDLGESQPAVVAVLPVADLHAPTLRMAALDARLPRGHGRV